MERFTHATLLICGICILAGCGGQADAKRKTLVMKYYDFGPQAMSCELIGMGWYQWESHGDEYVDDAQNIRVVVYKDVPLETVMTYYPVDPDKKQDYRYVEYSKAMAFLADRLDELEEWHNEEPQRQGSDTLVPKIRSTMSQMKTFFDDK